jgi:hypothetical protein
MNRRVLVIVTLILFSVFGCSTNSGADARELMLKAARSQDRHFPNEKDVKLTQFAYIGLVNAKGQSLYVINVRSVIPGMLAPRGNSWLDFFDNPNHLLGTALISGQPLWCEGSRIYFFGSQSNGDTEGNALEVADGIDNCKFVYIAAPGSWLPDNDADAPKWNAEAGADR